MAGAGFAIAKGCGYSKASSGQVIIYNQMVVRTQEQERADLLFSGLADATRRDILRRSLQGEHSISALARCYPISFAAVQKHVATLERAGLITKVPRGREKIVRGNAEAIALARALLDQFEAVWRDRLDRFGEVLEQ